MRIAGGIDDQNPGTRKPPSIGSLGWSIQASIDALRDWRASLRPTLIFLATAVLTVLTIHTFHLPGGVLPALPVLLVMIVHHSVRLLLQRIGVISVALGGSYLLAGVLSEQPWLLVIIVSITSFLGFYLLVRGLDLLSYLMAISIPVLIAWQAINGFPIGEAAWTNFQQVMTGLVISGVIGILFLSSGIEVRLRERLSSNLASIGHGLQETLETEYGQNFTVWDPAGSASLEVMLRGLRHQRGQRVSVANLVLAGDSTRYLLALNRLRLVLVEHGRPEIFVRYTGESIQVLRELLAAQLIEISESIRTRRVAREVPGFHASARRFRYDCRRAIRDAPLDTPATDLSFIAAVSTLILDESRLCRLLRQTTTDELAVPSRGLRMPKWDQRRDWTVGSCLHELVHRPDSAGLIFASKGVISMWIAFAITSAFDQWGGAGVFLLMTMFLSTVYQGSLRASLMLRAVGLFSATAVSLFAMTTVFPNLDDPWTYAVFIAVLLAPGAILMMNARTGAAGLNYAMSLLFIFSLSDRPSVHLDLIEERFVSVAAASVLPWMVFGIIKPTYARDRINEFIGKAILEIRFSVGLIIRSGKTNDAEIRSLGRGLDALSRMRKILGDATMEFADDEEQVVLHQKMLDCIDQLFIMARFIARTSFVAHRIGVTSHEATATQRILNLLDELPGDLTRKPDPDEASRRGAIASQSIMDMEAKIVASRQAGSLRANERASLIRLIFLTQILAEILTFQTLLTDRTRLLKSRRRIGLGDG